MLSSLLPRGGAFQQLLSTELGKRSLERDQKTAWKNTRAQKTLCPPLPAGQTTVTSWTDISSAGGAGGVCVPTSIPLNGLGW